MNHPIQKICKGQGGFTLIEILLVVFIVAIISAAVILSVGGFMGTGTREAAITEKDTVQTAILSGMGDAGVE